jgi:hypothetical protein
MTAAIIDIAQCRPADGSWLATVELWRRPDGKLIVTCADMPRALIESMAADAPEPGPARLRLLADWITEGAAAMRCEADMLALDATTPSGGRG